MVNKKQLTDYMKKVYEVIVRDDYSEKMPGFPLSAFSDSTVSNPSKTDYDEEEYLQKIKQAHECLLKDLDFFMLSDPAADSVEEVLICYPGFKAIVYHRIAYILYQMGCKIGARIISEEAHFLTGIDIHPGAKIGCPFFIDHGTGIVIGETTIIGDNVKIYQGVTLGALSLSKGCDLKGIKRHPTILNNVTIYSGASILGDITIGNNCVIGSNVFLLERISDNRRVVLSKPELIVSKRQ